MPIKDYSTTAGSNTSVDGVNIAEGCLPGNVNNAMRAMMADTRSFYQSGGWIDLGYTYTYASSSSFTVSSDVTSFYPVGQRVRAVGATTGTIYGEITGSSYSAPNTTVTVSWDSGSLQSETLTVSVSFMTVTGSPVSTGDVTGPASATDGGVALYDGTGGKTLKDGPTIGSGSGSLLRTDGDGSSLTGVTDTVARDRAMAAYIKADINANDPAGVYGDLISDNFISDTLSTKTNATYDATGDYYSNLGSPTQISQATGTNIGNMTGGGGVAASFDGNTNQNDGAGSQISATSGWVGKNWGTTYQVSQARVWRPNNAGIDGVAGSGTITVTIEGSATGSWGGEEVSLGSNTATDYDGARGGSSQSSDDAPSSYDYIEVDVTPTSYAYHRAVVSGAGTEVRIAEVQFFEPGTPTNMTLRPSATTLEDADPANITVYFRVEDIDSVTEETDRIVKVSIDNGSTWETCEITRVGAFGANDTLIKAEGNVSAQTGSTYLWELTTANSKSQRIKQVVSLPSD